MKALVASFAALVKLAGELDEQQLRAVNEGLSEIAKMTQNDAKADGQHCAITCFAETV